MNDEFDSQAIVPIGQLALRDGTSAVRVNSDHHRTHLVTSEPSVVLDRAALAHYSLVIRNRYLEATGLAFQDFVVDIIERRNPGDFDRVRPTGSIGDRKCDGRIRSTSTIIACYGPRQVSPSEVASKIKSDFAGAQQQWPEMKAWRFVQNDRDGIGPDVVRVLDELREANPSIAIEVWGFNEIKQEALRLSEADLIELYGYPPIGTDQVTIAALMPVIEHVGRVAVPATASVRPVPPHKIAYNDLGDDVQALLAAGMRKVDVVRRYFDEYYDPKLGDEVAEALRQKYEQCRQRGLAPDDIFAELQALAAGSASQHQGAAHQAAVYAVLAFFFEECDVFEEPPEGWSP